MQHIVHPDIHPVPQHIEIVQADDIAIGLPLELLSVVQQLLPIQ